MSIRSKNWSKRRAIAVLFATGFALAAEATSEIAAPAHPQNGGIEWVPNLGQFSPEVRFDLATGGTHCSLLATAIRFDVIEDWKRVDAPLENGPVAVPIYRRVQWNFEGANSNAQAQGDERRDVVANYFLGNDPARWASAVPTFGAVVVNDLYPYIDLRVRRAGSGVEYDFELRPGADPSAVQIRIDGASHCELTRDGALRIPTAGGAELIQEPPRSFEFDASGSRQPLASRFVAIDDDRFRLELTGWNGTSRAIVDPIVAQPQGFSFLGGREAEFGFDVTTFLGKPIVTGCTLTYPDTNPSTADFPITPGAFQATFEGAFCAFVSQFSADTGLLKWSTFYGSDPITSQLSESPVVVAAQGVSVDGEGAVYIAGYSTSADLPIISGSAQPFAAGGGDGFVAKLTNSGSTLSYATYVTASFIDVVEDIEVDPNGRAHFTGWSSVFGNPPLPTTTGTVEATLGSASGYVGFVGRLAATGASFEYLTFVGTGNPGGHTRPQAIALDYDDADPTRVLAVIAGSVEGENGLQTPGGFDSTIGGESDGFVAVLNHNATAWSFGTLLGGDQAGPTNKAHDRARGVAVNPSHIIAVTGYTGSTNFPTTSDAVQSSLLGDYDAFVVRIDPAATVKLLYSSLYGGSADEHGNCIDIDGSGALYVAGWTTSQTQLPIVDESMAQPATSGGRDAFMLKVRTSSLHFSSYLGGSGVDVATGIALEPGALFITGTSLSPDFASNLGATVGFDPSLNSSGIQTSIGPSPHPATPPWNLDDETSLGNFIMGSDAYIARFELP